jgi:hypothetical protein
MRREYRLAALALAIDMSIHTLYSPRTFSKKGPHVQQILSLTGKFLYFLMGWQKEQ